MKLVSKLLTGSLLMLGAATASAGMIMTVDYGDGSSGVGSLLNANTMEYNGSGDGFFLSLGVGVQQADSNPLLHLTTGAYALPGACNVTDNTGGCSVAINFSFDEYLLNNNPLATNFTSGIGGSLTNIDMSYFVTATDSNGNVTVLHDYDSTVLPVSGAYMDVNETPVLLDPGMYTLSATVTYSSSSNGMVTGSSDSSITVPEPASLALMGLGLLGMGAARRRRA